MNDNEQETDEKKNSAQGLKLKYPTQLWILKKFDEMLLV